MRAVARSRGAKQAPKRLPKPFGPGSVTISDGTTCAGTIVFADGEHHLFDPSGHWLGAYPSRQAAMKAAPPVGVFLLTDREH
jgi:hypothetical protein